MKKRYIVLFTTIVVLAIGIMFPFLQSAHRMKEYLHIVNPHFASYAKLFATYNPVGENFDMRIIDDSGAEIFLEYVSGGLVIDETRANKYMEERNIPTYITADDNSIGTLYCYWKYNSPAEPLFILSVRDSAISVTDENQLEDTLKARMLSHYEQLPDAVTDNLFRCLLHHQTDSASYRITVNITANDDFTSLLNHAKITKEELKR